MKKDIEIPEVIDIAVAIVQEKSEDGEWVWNAYLLNLKSIAIDTVLVSTKGYGEKEGEQRKTSILRHLINSLGPKGYAKIEELKEEVFPLTNEFLVSFFIGNKMFDKKYLFLPDSIKKEHMTRIPLLEKKGVMIK